MEPGTTTDDGLARELDGELSVLRGAILLVAGHGARRVDVAGLRLARVVLGEAERLADEQGVRIVPLWTTDEQQFDVRIERIEAVERVSA